MNGAGFSAEVATSIDALPADAYDKLLTRCGAPAYYDRRFLRAVERYPLLPCHRTRYIVVRRGADLLAAMPVYLQPVHIADPFGLLATTTSATFSPNHTGLFSHVMHCCDTRILADPPAVELYRAVFEKLASLAKDDGTAHFALVNVADPDLIAAARSLDLEVNHMVDRFAIDLSPIPDFESLIAAHMPNDGRHEIRRQSRLYAASNDRIVIETPPFPNLEEVGRLCHETTARRGTPAYLPAAALSHFVAECGDLVRLISIYSGDRRISAAILLIDRGTVHFWLAGMTYTPGTFSPYTMTLKALFDYAFAHGCQRIECGRLNANIKRRFGFSPVALHSIINRVPLAGPDDDRPEQARCGPAPVAEPPRTQVFR